MSVSERPERAGTPVLSVGILGDDLLHLADDLDRLEEPASGFCTSM